MKKPFASACVLLILTASLLTLFTPTDAAEVVSGEVVIESGYRHLGDTVVREWTETTAEPEGFELILKFNSQKNTQDRPLLFSQRNVDAAWAVTLNNRLIGTLSNYKETKLTRYAVPAGVLRDGENVLKFKANGRRPTDDIVIGDVKLLAGTFREALKLGRITVAVNDKATGEPLPTRVTIVDKAGRRPEIFYPDGNHHAVRNGVIYTMGTPTQFEVPAGEYTLYSTRGMEWSLDTTEIQVTFASESSASLQLIREVDTTGFVAADTHIHTLTYSGHGDSNMPERMVTLAGEGVELAIATDHNHNTDYAPQQLSMGLQQYFTPVVGNEVTTGNGHFNAFPLDPKATPPGMRFGRKLPVLEGKDWPALMKTVRDKGAKVIILNHPRWPNRAEGPLGIFAMDRSTGLRAGGPPTLGVDAMELMNSGVAAMEDRRDDPLYGYQDWFALLNRGEKIAAVGSSDSHTVGNPVGLGRSYVPSKTDDPAKIDIDASCIAFKEGRCSVSLGIFTDIHVNGSSTMGDLVTADGKPLQVKVRVASASWIVPRRALLFYNGVQVAEQAVSISEGQATNVNLKFELPTPKFDGHLVCVVIGDGVKLPSWANATQYTIGATNPVWIDADGDRKYSHLRATATKLLTGSNPDVISLGKLLEQHSPALQAQLLSVAKEKWPEEWQPALDKLVNDWAEGSEWRKGLRREK